MRAGRFFNSVSVILFKSLQKELTIAKRDQSKGRPTVDARVDSGELGIDKPFEFCVARRLLAIRCCGDNSLDVDSAARVLAVCNSVGNEGVSVGHVGRLRKVDHGVRVVLLRAGVGVGEESVDAVYTCELHTRVVREDVPAADKLE